MTARQDDGSAGDVDYGGIGGSYASYRQPEPAIAALIDRHLGAAGSVMNVGAGAGSYEPAARHVTAVEPSATMRAQRPATRPRAIGAHAESLPFADATFDAAMATFTVHQWQDLASGLAEMRRVTRGPILILTCDPVRVQDFWLNEYAPRVLATEARRYPPLNQIAEALGGIFSCLPVPIPLHCRDGFNEAYHGRPERLLDTAARLACSAWSFIDDAIAHDYVERLRTDLKTGAWDRRYAHLRSQRTYSGSLRLLVCRPGHKTISIKVLCFFLSRKKNCSFFKKEPKNFCYLARASAAKSEISASVVLKAHTKRTTGSGTPGTSIHR